MTKHIVIIMATLMLSACSMSSRDWAAVSSAMDSGEFATGECKYNDSDNQYLGYSEEVKVYSQRVCNNVYVTFINSSYSIEYKCDIIYEGLEATRYVKPVGSAELTVDPERRSSKGNYLRCSKYNTPAEVDLDNPSFRTKISNGHYLVGLKNDDDFKRVCEFSDSDGNLIKDNVIVDADSWSQWIDFENGISTNCVRYYQ